MLNLIKKELKLTTHPTAFIFLFFGILIFIPNYPYEVIFFFSTLSAFFTCQNSRENKDLFFSCILPIKKKNVAFARIITVMILQMCSIVLTAIFVTIKNVVPSLYVPNLAGMDANIGLIAEGFILFGIFNITFFPLYFSEPTKIGKPFFISSCITFLLIGLSVALCSTILVIKNTVDTPEPICIGVKLIFLFLGLFLYFTLSIASCFISSNKFEKVNL